MKRFYLAIAMIFVGVSVLWSQHANVVWDTPSRNSSESMPCGGGDIGMNIWVEEGDILFYLSRSGTFDENNCQLKLGRFRLRLSPNPFEDAKDFRQELKLIDGSGRMFFIRLYTLNWLMTGFCRLKYFMKTGDTRIG